MIHVPDRSLILPIPKVEGFFEVRKFRGPVKFCPETGEVEKGNLVDLRRGPNLVTNWGLDWMGDKHGEVSGRAFEFCSMGTGTTPPAETDVTMQSVVATQGYANSNGDRGVDQTDWYAYRRFTYNFSPTAFNGQSLAEIGLGRLNNGTELWSRALVKDPNTGNPLPIVVLNGETLQVYYDTRTYIPTVDDTGTVDIDAATHNYTLRAARASSYTYWAYNGFDVALAGDVFAYGNNATLGTITGTPSGTSDSGIWTGQTYPGNGFYFKDNGARWTHLEANFPDSEIDCMMLGTGLGTYQIQLTPPVVKTTTQTFEFSVRLNWDRYP